MMSQVYMSRRRTEDTLPAQEPLQTAVPGPSLQELAEGAAPSREQMGRRVDLSEAIRAKMEASFGANFSNVRLYESQTVADAGADAMAMGSSIGFAPGKLDLGSTAGQAMLGHELSHVVSQARGEAGGIGFLADAGLEARADREGALAAAGESVYSGPVTPISNTSTALSAAGPMQAVGKREKERLQAECNQTEAPSFFNFTDRRALRDQYDKEKRNKKRPWEMRKKDFKHNHFNPGDVDEISRIQERIDGAASPQQAYAIFMEFTGNTGDNVLDVRDGADNDVDLELFKNKLKNMSRMVHDYPELKDKIGNMKMYRNEKSSTSMSAFPVSPGSFNLEGRPLDRSELTYNMNNDRKGVGGALERLKTKTDEFFSGFSAADTSYDGNHELGHTLNSLIRNPNKRDDWHYRRTADVMLQGVLSDLNVGGIQYYDRDSTQAEEDKNIRFRDGQVNLRASGLHKKGLTSGYGQTNAAEFFAEAFADVYAHGKKARPASIKMVEQYEKYREAMFPNASNP